MIILNKIILRVCNLSIHYGAHTALSGVDFAVKPGSFVALIGPNGSGKSTLLRAISRLLKPNHGLIYLDERDMQKIPLPDISRSIAVVPQDTAVDFDFSVEEIVAMGRYPHLRRFQKEQPEDRRIILEAQEQVGIAHLSARSASNLSGGERQRVIIARALAQEPKILLLDEPTANLDLSHQVEFLDLALKLNRDKGVTVIAAIHDLNLAAQFFEQFILLSAGEILALGRPEQVLTPENIRTAYKIEVVVQRHPFHGKLHVTVAKGNGYPAPDKNKPKIHLIGGGEEAVPLLTALLEAGFHPSIGPLTREDSGHRLALYHGLSVITLTPFSPISDVAHRQHLEQINRARFIVVPPIPFGPGNLRNLEAVSETFSTRRPVLLMEDTAVTTRDYCGGRAVTLLKGLKDKGAQSFGLVDDLLHYLESRGNQRDGNLNVSTS